MLMQTCMPFKQLKYFSLDQSGELTKQHVVPRFLVDSVTENPFDVFSSQGEMYIFSHGTQIVKQ